MKKLLKDIWPQLITVGFLLWAVSQGSIGLDFQSQQLLQFLVVACCGYAVYWSYQKKKMIWIWVFAVLAVWWIGIPAVFNEVAWHWIHIVTLLSLLISIIFSSEEILSKRWLLIGNKFLKVFYGTSVVLFFPWFLGEITRGDMSFSIYKEINYSRALRSNIDYFICIYGYLIFYITAIGIIYMIYKWSYENGFHKGQIEAKDKIRD
ncbi:MAG TPA: DUF6804 family protein [Candidatus Paceibacterota bacterium]|nr:DUF6804 family protein [Candidatus Paceibacterota bacterium]